MLLDHEKNSGPDILLVLCEEQKADTSTELGVLTI